MQRHGFLLVLAILLPPGALDAQVRRLTDLRGRNDCDLRAFRDPVASVSQLFDSTALDSLVRATKRAPPNQYSMLVRIGLDQQITGIELSSSGRAPEDYRVLLNSIRHLSRLKVDGVDSGTVMISVAPDGDPVLLALPTESTCPAMLANPGDVRKRFARSLATIRKRGILTSDAHGLVQLTYIAEPNGEVGTATVVQSSGVPAVDRAAIDAVTVARARPAVQGKYALRALLSQSFRY